MTFTSVRVSFFAVLFILPAVAHAGGLRGSPSSMKEQHAVAIERDLKFTGDAGEVLDVVQAGALDSVRSNGDFILSRVSYPYAIPEVRLFIERLGRQYFDAHGVPLVVTSLTRPAENQPRNAHQLSVHPAGMAVDFRVPRNATQRAWLESALLQLENRGILDVTRERNPPHYHVAVFPAAYSTYVAKLPPLEPRSPVEAKQPLQPAAVNIRATITAPDPQRAAPDAGMPPILLVVIAMTGAVFTALLFKRRAPA